MIYFSLIISFNPHYSHVRYVLSFPSTCRFEDKIQRSFCFASGHLVLWLPVFKGWGSYCSKYIYNWWGRSEEMASSMKKNILSTFHLTLFCLLWLMPLKLKKHYSKSYIWVFFTTTNNLWGNLDNSLVSLGGEKPAVVLSPSQEAPES